PLSPARKRGCPRTVGRSSWCGSSCRSISRSPESPSSPRWPIGRRWSPASPRRFGRRPVLRRRSRPPEPAPLTRMLPRTPENASIETVALFPPACLPTRNRFHHTISSGKRRAGARSRGARASRLLLGAGLLLPGLRHGRLLHHVPRHLVQAPVDPVSLGADLRAPQTQKTG